MSDYIGFTYNGVHSSDLGIVRVSNGSRFDENLLPTMQDKTVPVPGGDGTYYFGSYYTQRQFTIPFAFDALTEQQFERLRTHFGDKKIHDLIFDERPYKTYSAKATGTATIKYIPFDDTNKGRIYKGEGSVQFTCYQPFAICNKKYLDEYTEENKEEWAGASRLLDSRGEYDTLKNGVIKLYNPGVKESDWTLTIDANNSNREVDGYIFSIEDTGLSIRKIELKQTPTSYDTRITINSKTNLIEGWYKDGAIYRKSGNLYNEYVTGGDFFKIPCRTDNDFKLNIQKLGDISSNETIDLKYDYYYF